MNKDTLPFSEKYRPRKIEELVLDKIILNKINSIIKYKDIPNINPGIIIIAFVAQLKNSTVL